MKCVQTDLFQVSAGRYMRRLCAMWFARNWWWFALPLVACAALTWVDVRWAIIALMLIFMVFPMILTLLYFNFAFAPVARLSVMEKSMMIDESGVRLSFTHERMNDHEIRWSEIAKVQLANDNILLILRQGRFSFFMIPLEALSTDQVQTLKTIARKSLRF